jgi:hypothetical protein
MSNSIKRNIRVFTVTASKINYEQLETASEVSRKVKFVFIARCKLIACRSVPLQNTYLFCESRGIVCLYLNGGKLASFILSER